LKGASWEKKADKKKPNGFGQKNGQEGKRAAQEGRKKEGVREVHKIGEKK